MGGKGSGLSPKQVRQIIINTAKRLGLKPIFKPGVILYYVPPNRVYYDHRRVYEGLTRLGCVHADDVVYEVSHEYCHHKQIEACPELFNHAARVVRTIIKEFGFAYEIARDIIATILDAHIQSGFYRKVLPEALVGIFEKGMKKSASALLDITRVELILLDEEDKQRITRAICCLALFCELPGISEAKVSEAIGCIKVFHPKALPLFEAWRNLIKKTKQVSDVCELQNLIDEGLSILREYVRKL